VCFLICVSYLTHRFLSSVNSVSFSSSSLSDFLCLPLLFCETSIKHLFNSFGTTFLFLFLNCQFFTFLSRDLCIFFLFTVYTFIDFSQTKFVFLLFNLNSSIYFFSYYDFRNSCIIFSLFLYLFSFVFSLLSILSLTFTLNIN
jgi:hypothetical protein